MMKKLQSIGFAILTIAASGCFASQAQAEAPLDNISEQINNALFNQSGDVYSNSGIAAQAGILFGLSNHEHAAINDAEAVLNLYRQAMRQQGGNKPIRTTDLPSPFTSSLRTTPAQIQANYREVKSADAGMVTSPEAEAITLTIDTPEQNTVVKP